MKDVLHQLHAHLQYCEAMGVTELPRVVVTPSPTVMVPSADAPTLEQIRATIGDCQRCGLCKERTNIVFGVGNPQADLMFIGEGPGADEDRLGEPFVGRAGQLLNKILAAMGLQRNEVFIGNIVKCLRYDASVLLGDGTWERIGRLVRRQYAGTVMSVDPQGHMVPRRVTGWHATPLANRQVYKLSYRSAKNAGMAKSAIYLTGDHPVLTARGYIAVQDLTEIDRIATGHGFSATTRNLIYGSLLGDGHINASSAHFSFSHSIKQADYARFKASLLVSELGCTIDTLSVAAVIGGEHRYPIIKCYTRAHRSLHLIRQMFYDQKKKKIPTNLSVQLNPMMLAFWFMDDGYLRVRTDRQPLAEIATCAFTVGDIHILITGLRRLGMEAYERGGRIYFTVRETVKLSEIIAPYIPPSMRYKLHPAVALRIPFNPDVFAAGPAETTYDLVEAAPVEHTGSDKTFFCIDVEETNNFVTSGGVVHNCRPPGNRAPLPDEAATCLPFLLQQIDAIRPKIIVCLGSVAVRFLLADDSIKITRVRGQFREWRGIKVMPTYHPAFLLRNPNMKRPVWDDMQQVMAALGLPPPATDVS